MSLARAARWPPLIGCALGNIPEHWPKSRSRLLDRKASQTSVAPLLVVEGLWGREQLSTVFDPAADRRIPGGDRGCSIKCRLDTLSADRVEARPRRITDSEVQAVDEEGSLRRRGQLQDEWEALKIRDHQIEVLHRPQLVAERPLPELGIRRVGWVLDACCCRFHSGYVTE